MDNIFLRPARGINQIRSVAQSWEWQRTINGWSSEAQRMNFARLWEQTGLLGGRSQVAGGMNPLSGLNPIGRRAKPTPVRCKRWWALLFNREHEAKSMIKAVCTLIPINDNFAFNSQNTACLGWSPRHMDLVPCVPPRRGLWQTLQAGQKRDQPFGYIVQENGQPCFLHNEHHPDRWLAGCSDVYLKDEEMFSWTPIFVCWFDDVVL